MCDERRPDILRSDIFIGDNPCDEKCEDCSDECDPTPEICDCPYGHLSGNCVHYTGCDTFLLGVKPSDTLNGIVFKMEQLLSSYRNTIVEMQEKIVSLENDINTLKQTNNEECDNWA